MTVNGSGNAKRDDEVDPAVGAVGGDAVEQVVDDRLDPWPESLDAPWREGARDQPAEPGVVRRIDGEHVPGECRSGETLGHDGRVGGQRGVHVLRQPRVVECCAGLVVADDQPRIVAVDERHRVDRAAPAHVGEQGERVVAVARSPCLQRRGHVVLDHRGGILTRPGTAAATPTPTEQPSEATRSGPGS